MLAWWQLVGFMLFIIIGFSLFTLLFLRFLDFLMPLKNSDLISKQKKKE